MLRFAPLLLLLAMPAQAQELTPDLKLVPTDAVGFLHVKLADVWKGDAVKDFRDILAMAGPKAFEQIEKEFYPPVRTIDRVTTVVLNAEETDDPPQVVTILAFTEPFDSDKISRAYFPGDKPKRQGTKEYLYNLHTNLAAYIADKQTLVIADGKVMPKFLAMPNKPGGPLAGALATAVKPAMTVGVNPQLIPQLKELEKVTIEFRSLAKARSVVFTADSLKAVRLRLSFSYATEDDAKDGHTAVIALCQMMRNTPIWKEAKQNSEKLLNSTREKREKHPKEPHSLDDFKGAIAGLFATAGYNWADQKLENPPVKRDGTTTTIDFSLPTYITPFFDLAIAASGLGQLSFQQEAIVSPMKMAMKNLRTIGMAMQNYDSANGKLPGAATDIKNGAALLSWRVAILPYIEEDNLYNQFKLDEPWDSDHNKKLIPKMPKVYFDPRFAEGKQKPGMTHFKVFTGKDAIFNTPQIYSIAALTSTPRGASDTILVAAAGDAVTWTKPEDFEYDDKKAIPDLTKPFPELLVLMGDGRVRKINPKMDNFEKILRAHINPNSPLAISFDD